MRNSFFLTFMAVVTLGLSQSMKEKILIIDTLEGLRNDFAISIKKSSIFEHFFGDKDTILEIRSNYPNVLKRVSFNDSNDILRLALDDSGGHFDLQNVYSLKSDTIRISRFTVFHNCLPDSIYNNITWYWKDSSGIKPISSEERKHYKKYKRRMKPVPPKKEIFMTINGNKIRCELKNRRAEFSKEAWYHGTPKMRTDKEYLEYEELRSRVNYKQTDERFKYFAAQNSVYTISYYKIV